MSRSYKRPYSAWVVCRSCKKWKRFTHRSLRALVKSRLFREGEDMSNVINKNEYSDVWDSPRDGKQHYFGDSPYLGMRSSVNSARIVK